MTRQRSASTMGPPPDRDVVMGPPPVPASLPQQNLQQKSKDTQEITDKYKKLKRRYFELEEKHKTTTTELQKSGERNVKMRGERDILLDRIMELEAQSPPKVPNGSISQMPLSGAFPKSLLNARARNSFTTNLRQAMNEDDTEDDVDPLLTSRHVGPAARKRADEEKKERQERQEEDARELRRSQRSRKPQNPYPVSVAHIVSNQKGKEVAGTLPAQPLSTYAPASSLGEQSPVLVSNKGTRLRIKLPQPPQGSPVPGPSDSQQPMASSSSQSHQIYTYPPPHQEQRSQSPVSPIITPPDESVSRSSYSPSHYRNGNAPQSTTNNGNGHGPSMPRRSSSSSHPSNSPTTPQHQQLQLQHQHLFQAQQQPPLQQQMQHPPTASGSSNGRTPDTQRQAKPKRLKAHTVTSKSFSIPMVPRDKKGRPMLPLNVGIMTVISLGEVCMREHFHTERYIFPVGYEVTRRYLSTLDPMNEVVYNCTILDGGDGPKFQIVPSDAPERAVIAGTATGAWSNIVRQANGIRNRQHSNSVSGPDFFGLGQNTIKHLIQELTNSDRLSNYVWQNFVEGGPLGGRHAAVIPALPEDYQEQGTLAAHHPDHQTRERRRRASVSEKEELLSPTVPQHQTSTPSKQQPQPGLTTIILPPPTTAETLTIQEYQPPSKDTEKRVTRGRAAARAEAHSQSPTPVASARRSPGMRTRGSTRNDVNADSGSASLQPSAPQAQPSGQTISPYIREHPSPPPVPATLASIMNAYPGPAAPESRSGSANEQAHGNGNASGSASNGGSE